MTIRLGRRSIFLLMMGVVFCTYGFNVAAATPATLMGTFRYLPQTLQGLVGTPFLFAGLVAIVTAIAAPRFEWLGFLALYVVSGLWSATFVVACFLDGWPRAAAGALVWSLVLGMVILIAGWPEPDPGRAPPSETENGAHDERAP